MPDDEFELGTTFLIPKKLRKRQYLAQASDVSQWLAFISRGCLRQYSLDDQGSEHILRFGIEGWWMTDLESYQSRKPSTSNIDALEDSELLLINNDSLEKLTAASRNWDRYFRTTLENEYMAAVARIADFVSAPAEQRYERFLATYPDLFQRLPLQQIASYLGITPQSLSRIRKQLATRK